MEASPSETRASSSPSHPLDPGGFAPGRILADRYRIVALVGRGGMGEVYRADDLKLGQPVALKFLPRGLEREPAARDRLLAEVRSARTVSHPNVCRVYDVGELTGPALSERPSMNSGRPEALEGRSESKGRVFLTMEYIVRNARPERDPSPSPGRVEGGNSPRSYTRQTFGWEIVRARRTSPRSRSRDDAIAARQERARHERARACLAVASPKPWRRRGARRDRWGRRGGVRHGGPWVA